MGKKNKAIFLDRDGTLNKNYGYINDVKKFNWLKNTKKALSYLKKKGFKLIIVTNQSGVARGIITLEQIKKIHDYMNKDLFKSKIKIDAFYFCPYHPKFKIKKFEKFKNLRKPSIGMIKKAKNKFNIDLKKSFMIGDSYTDFLTAKRAGLVFFYKKKQNLFDLVKTRIK